MKCTYACGSAEHTIARRSFLGGMAGLGIVGGLGALAQPAAAEQLTKDQKRVVVFNMHGGLSQLESWDPKPGTDTGGPFLSIPTSVPGVHLSELLPETAKIMHHLCVIRGVNTAEDDHGKGAYMMMTGRRPSPAADYPMIGAVAAKALSQGSQWLQSMYPVFRASSITRPRNPEQSMNSSPSMRWPPCRTNASTKPSSPRSLTSAIRPSVRVTPRRSA